MLRISLLGEQVIDDDSTGVVRTRSARTLALVGYLALHAGTPQNRQLIAGLFWPDSTDAQALTNLRRELHHLRQLLGGDGSLAVTSTDLSWRDTVACRVDVRVLVTRHRDATASRAAGEVAAAERYADEGIAVYGGDFLPTVYDDWAVAARDRLRRACVELCDLRGGVEAARRRIALEPLEEVGYRSLMALQVEMGDRAGAISTYHHCASVLERELGVSPDPATRQALERLIGRTDSTGDLRLPSVPGPRPAGPPLIGRDAPLRDLGELWAAAELGGQARVVVVRGEPGVGKSRLVTELAERVRARHGTVAATQCFDTTGRLALAPVAEWLRTDDLRQASASLDPVWRREVERLVPDVDGAAPPGSSGDRAMVDAWQRHRFFEGVAQAFLAVPRPLLLVLDNLQWCDEETLAWISFVLASAPPRGLLVAATLREDDDGTADPAVSQWLSRLRTGHLVDEVPLAALDVAATALLSEAVTGRRLSEEESTLVHAATGGFPLFVVEATRAATGSDQSVRAREELATVLRRRIGQTSPHAQQTASLAAAMGRDVTLDVLTDASDLDADSVARSVDELWRRRILRELGSGYDFSHDLLRDAAYSMVSPPQRWLLHRRLAQALELSAGEEDSIAALLAEQYDRGGRPDRALPHYTRAAEVAAHRYAPAESIRLHRQALRVIEAQPPGRQRDQRELDCLLATAAPLNALNGYASLELHTVLQRAVALAERIGSSRLLVTSLTGLWASTFVRGEIIDSRRLGARALSVSEVDDVLLGEAHFAFAGSAVTLGRPAEAVEHFDEAHDRCRGAESLAVGTMPEVHALAWAAHAHWLLGQSEVAAERTADAVQRARAFAHPYSLAVALAYAAITYQLLDDRPALRRTVDELGGLCERYGFAYYREWGLILDGWLRGGPEGVATMREGIENLRAQLALARMPYWLALLAHGLAGCGQPDAAAATLDAARTSAGSRGDAWWLPEVQRLRAALSTDDTGEELLRSALALAERQGSVALAERCRADLAAARTPAGAAFGAVSPDPNAGRTLRS